MPNSPVAIATASVTRLVKEEASYRSELQQQQERVRKLEAAAGDDDDGNREYVLRQEVRNAPGILFDLGIHFLA